MSFKQAIIIRTDLGMGKGKMIAQGAHASIEAFIATQKKNPGAAKDWLGEGMKKVVLKVDSKEALTEAFEEVKNLIPAKLIRDAGHTQIPSGSLTCLGVGPAKEEEIDKFFSKFKLL